MVKSLKAMKKVTLKLVTIELRLQTLCIGILKEPCGMISFRNISNSYIATIFGQPHVWQPHGGSHLASVGEDGAHVTSPSLGSHMAGSYFARVGEDRCHFNSSS